MKLITVAAEKDGVLSRIRFGVTSNTGIVIHGDTFERVNYYRTERKTPQGHIIFTNQKPKPK